MSGPAMTGKLWARSLLLQATWNFERMQNLGFSYVVSPWLERVYPDDSQRRAALLRHQEFFNTNPYMAPIVVGMVCALEEEAARLPEAERAAALERLAALKKGAAPPLAGLGDTLFWQSLRPFCAAAALAAGAAAYFAGGAGPAPWAMALCYLLLFNMAAAGLRWKGFGLGYAWKEQLAAKLKAYPWQAWIRRLRLAGTGLAIGLLALLLFSAGGRGERALGALAVVLCLIADRALLKPVSVYRLYAGASALGALAAVMGWL